MADSAKSIMIQGTMSNAGKSLIAAALCRIFRQDGYSVAPFKSQNMALNSYITADGLEMGRAQVMQAEAAGVEPSVLMNPILLKPTSDIGSQVIVNGEVVGNMRAMEYFRRKREFIPQIMDAYSTLSAQHDIIVIEGAGSPAELNLKADDIVNMGMAKLAKSPVLLVGDIDRGGVFAQLIGTVKLLEQSEQDMIKALIVNKFRGDRSIFKSGVEILEQRSGKPVAGVVPYVRCDIEDEDSLSAKLDSHTAGLVDIAVIRLPRISNFTDLDVFSQYSGVSVRYVTKPEQLGAPDMIVIPGTKSTISDMKWLRECGLEAALKKSAAAGTLIFGICGGYQLLGEVISDPECSEGGGEIRGLELLHARTVFTSEKRRTRTSGKFSAVSGGFSFLSGAGFSGYEIHMGRTESSGEPLLSTGDGAFSGNVCGCYIHGIFDSEEVSGRLVSELFRRKGLEYTGSPVDRDAYKQSQYDLLADSVRESLDMELIYKIIREGI